MIKAIINFSDKKIDVGVLNNDLIFPNSSVIYEKIEIIIEKIKIYPSVFFNNEHIQATCLISPNEKNKKALGINCYAFAVGRVPSETKDPTFPEPGGSAIQEIRKDLLKKLPQEYKKLFNVIKIAKRAIARTRLNKLFNFLDRSQQVIYFKDNKKILSSIELFEILIKTSQTVQEFIKKYDVTMKELKYFICKKYAIHRSKMDPITMMNLFEMDGLIKVYPIAEEKKKILCNRVYKFGVFFIAAFCKKDSDYHLLRFFKDGWYERSGNLIKKFEGIKDIPLGEVEDIAKAFYSNKRYDFVGYFIVPENSTNVSDEFGRKFVFEHHKT